MPYTKSQFEEAVKIVQSLPKDGPVQPTQSEQLILYGLYKQATEGDVSKARPGFLDFTGRAKWDAWNANKGLSADDAQSKYVEEFLAIVEAKDASSFAEIKPKIDAK